MLISSEGYSLHHKNDLDTCLSGVISILGTILAFRPRTSSNGINPSKMGVVYELYVSMVGLRNKSKSVPNPIRCFIKRLLRLLTPCSANNDLWLVGLTVVS